MMNFQVFPLASLVSMLVIEEKVIADRRRNLAMMPGVHALAVDQYRVEDSEANRLTGLFQFAHQAPQLAGTNFPGATHGSTAGFVKYNIPP
jgi:hypothetical protein